MILPRPLASRRLAPLLALTLAASLSACIIVPLPVGTTSASTASSGGPAPATTQCPRPAETAAYAAEVLRRANAVRVGQGLAPLRASDRLTRAAQAHACDNAAHQTYRHVGSDGAALMSRLARVGYAPRRATENTGLGFAGSPERLVDFWLGSPKHRANLLDPKVTEAGLGMAAGAKPAWVLVMATPLR